MSPDEIKALRKHLACTAKELAHALGVEQNTVFSWEKGELFPTKAIIAKMAGLRERGRAAIAKKTKSPEPMKMLADPQMWELLRKLLAHKKLRDDVVAIAGAYSDPALDSQAEI